MSGSLRITNQVQEESKKGLSKCCICCIVCSGCMAVFLAAVIPVYVFWIGPSVAQNILDHTNIALPNLTQAACSENYTWLFSSAEIHVPSLGPIALSSTIESFTQEVWTTSCDKDGAITPAAECGNNATEHQMGYYTSPAMSVPPGVNHHKFTVAMDSNTTLILNAWVAPLWVTQEKTRLILKAKGVRIKVLGIAFSGLTMRKEMTCTGVPGQPDIVIPASVCYPNSPKAQPTETNQYRATCVAGALDIATTTTSTTPSSKASTTTTSTSAGTPQASTIFA